MKEIDLEMLDFHKVWAMNMSELRQLAKLLNLKGYSKMKKWDLHSYVVKEWMKYDQKNQSL